MSLPWQNVTHQIVMSVEAPDFDTHVVSALNTNTTSARRSSWTRAYRQILFSFLGVFALFGLLTVWWTGSSMGWFFFWMSFVIVLGSLIVQYFRTVRRVTGRNPTWDSAAAVIVRNAAIAGDAKSAPLAQFQPTPPASALATSEPTTIADLYRPITLIVPGSTSAALMVTQTISLVVIIGALAAFVIVNNSLNFMRGLMRFLPWQYLAFYLIAIVAALGALIQQQRLRLPFSVTIDAQGVSWRQGRKRRVEPWSAAQALWLVAARRGQGQEPWYLLTTEPVATAEDAWRIVYAYARRWQIELTWRYGKSELALESPRVWSWEGRQKFLLLATLAYAFLLSLLRDDYQSVRQWLLRYWCHRTGTRNRAAVAPLYRLRSALSRLWLTYLPLPALAILQNSG